MPHGSVSSGSVWEKSSPTATGSVCPGRHAKEDLVDPGLRLEPGLRMDPPVRETGGVLEHAELAQLDELALDDPRLSVFVVVLETEDRVVERRPPWRAVEQEQRVDVAGDDRALRAPWHELNATAAPARQCAADRPPDPTRAAPDTSARAAGRRPPARRASRLARTRPTCTSSTPPSSPNCGSNAGPSIVASPVRA